MQSPTTGQHVDNEIPGNSQSKIGCLCQNPPLKVQPSTWMTSRNSVFLTQDYCTYKLTEIIAARARLSQIQARENPSMGKGKWVPILTPNPEVTAAGRRKISFLQRGERINNVNSHVQV